MATAFPETYYEWRRCITVDCGIELTSTYVDERLQALRDPANSNTSQFAETYGSAYLDQVIAWFQLAKSESDSGDGADSPAPPT